MDQEQLADAMRQLVSAHLEENRDNGLAEWVAGLDEFLAAHPIADDLDQISAVQIAAVLATEHAGAKGSLTGWAIVPTPLPYAGVEDESDLKVVGGALVMLDLEDASGALMTVSAAVPLSLLRSFAVDVVSRSVTAALMTGDQGLLSDEHEDCCGDED